MLDLKLLLFVLSVLLPTAIEAPESEVLAGHWSEWTHWSHCSVSCGEDGRRTRHRTCTHPTSGKTGRQPCDGSSTQHKTCHIHCPVDGHWSSWGSWSHCSISCGKAGTKTRHRTCSHPAPQYGGLDCHGRHMETDCCHHYCQGDGRWGPWSHFSACSVSCCNGSETRTRSCDHPAPSHGGRDCHGHSKDTRVCSNPCAGDAKWLSWAHWSICSVTCDGGRRHRTRTCANQSVCTGTCKGNSREDSSCNTNHCPGWTSWLFSPCSVTCGTGSKQGMRRCSSGHDEDCPGSAFTTGSCTEIPCPVDGGWGNWQTWGTCSHTCGDGTRTRHRSCDHPAPRYGGHDCLGNVTQTGACKIVDCPSWGSFYEASACSVTCGQGVIQIQRNCSTGNVDECAGKSYDEKPCTRPASISTLTGSNVSAHGDHNHDQPPVQLRFINNPSTHPRASWGAWTSDSVCSKTCNDGFKEFVRRCSTGIDHDCESDGGQYWKIDHCNDQPCGAQWAAWHVTKPCSVTCGIGVQTRQRSCSSGKAADCPGKYYEFGTCTPGPCSNLTTTTPVSTTTATPVWSAWSSPKPCSVTCGTGFTEKFRTCSTGNSRDCGGNPWQVIPCTPRSCLIDGVWDQWSSWGACTATCGPSQRTRNRTCTYQDTANRGAACSGDTSQTEDCTTSACPVDGTWEPWGSYSTCSASCGSGFKFRSRGCTFPPGVPHGNLCVGDEFDTNTCMKQRCAVDGVLSQWTSWSQCSHTCNSGTQIRTRVCTFDATVPHGKDCVGALRESQDCNQQRCPVDGVWSQWSLFGRCSASCGNGTHTKTRTCNFDPRYPRGANCSGPSTNTDSCFAGLCPVDGTLTQWSAWSTCSKTCGGGIRTRTRVCQFDKYAPHGKPCVGATSESQDCSIDKCSEWSAWLFTPCSVTCGTGSKQGMRRCSSGHEEDCPGPALTTENCTEVPCPVDGGWGTWQTWSTCSHTCGKGSIRTRQRSCDHPQPAYGGKVCIGNSTETVTCSFIACPQWSAWLFTPCSVTCGTGSKQGMRRCSSGHEEDCPGSAFTTQICTETPCPVDGVWGDWQAWGTCSHSCGDGTRTRQRSCDHPAPTNGGHDCQGNATQTGACKLKDCPTWGSFYEASACSVTCGQGVILLQRNCSTGNDDDCTGKSYDEKPCTRPSC